MKNDSRDVVTAGARHSPQIRIVASLANNLDLKSEAHLPTGDLLGTLADVAQKYGIQLVRHEFGRNVVLVHRAKEAAVKRDLNHIPFGMECDEAVIQTSKQVANLPKEIKRLVVPVGSGMTLAGILHGLEKHNMTYDILGVVVGASPIVRLNKYAPSGWEKQVTLVDAGIGYETQAKTTVIEGVSLSPHYEAKCIKFLRADDCLWIVGYDIDARVEISNNELDEVVAKAGHIRPEDVFSTFMDIENTYKIASLAARYDFMGSIEERRVLRKELLVENKRLTDGRNSLAREFLVPPVSVINTHTGAYRRLEKKWKKEMLLSTHDKTEWDYKGYIGESVFPLALAEILLTWFGGKSVFDPYCGFPNKGIVSLSLLKEYTGIDIRESMIVNNRKQCTGAEWLCDDGTAFIPQRRYDTLLACPPYYNLEVYSELALDISTLPSYAEFLERIEDGLKKQLPFINGYAIFVVGDIRDNDGFYRGLPNDIASIFNKLGWGTYNRLVLYTMGSAMIRARRQFNSLEKVAKVHQNILVFRRMDDGK